MNLTIPRWLHVFFLCILAVISVLVPILNGGTNWQPSAGAALAMLALVLQSVDKETAAKIIATDKAKSVASMFPKGPGSSLGCLLMALIVACSNLPQIAADIGNIAAIVIADVEAGKPFSVVLADTGTDDATLLAAIIIGIEGDPKLSATQKAAYATMCAPYLTQATQLAAAQHKQARTVRWVDGKMVISL